MGGVEWACELRFFFPDIQVTLVDFLPNCLGPLPKDSVVYCEQYMQRCQIKTFYGITDDRSSDVFLKKIGLPRPPEKTYVFSGVKHSNYFMPKDVLSECGPGGGGWIVIN